MHTALFTVLFPVIASGADRPDVLFADFEADSYGTWTVTGRAFGSGPAQGTLPRQMPVRGYRGARLVNSFHDGDGTIGTLTSPEFVIDRKYIAFLIGGGGHAGKTCLNLVVGGKVVRTMTGSNTAAGGTEELEPTSWDVIDIQGKKAQLVVVDDATGGWGHINVDHIVFTDTKPRGDIDASRDLMARAKYLHFPVKNGAAMRKVTVTAGGIPVRVFDIELADSEADWWASLDISAWKGQTLSVRAPKLPADSKALAHMKQSDTVHAAKDEYREPLRPGFHFTPRRGWTNDPNGLVFHRGEWHLFFQHNPYGTQWGNMHWGHAVSKDLVHWEERSEALYPDAMGPMFSGSAVVDEKNTTGLGKNDEPPLILAYTAAGNPTVQCLASSTDNGRTFTKFAGNPVLKQITPGNRDPKLLWHEPSKKWVMALYVERDMKHTIHFFTSPDLKAWTRTSVIDGFFECPDLFELPVDGDPKNKKWVLTAASSEYMVGAFDGMRFTPETPKLPGHRGKGFYAAQTFNAVPAEDGRVIQVGWFQAAAPGMPFNQAMTVPLELKLVSTADGPRLTWTPVKELAALRVKSFLVGPRTVTPGDDPLAGTTVELAEIRVEFAPGTATEIRLTIRGVPLVYHAKKQEWEVNGHRAPAPLIGDQQRLTILVDRTGIEVFASDGRTYVPMPVVPKSQDKSVSWATLGGTAALSRVEIHELRSIWAK